jgi:hypothetical protein
MINELVLHKEAIHEGVFPFVIDGKPYNRHVVLKWQGDWYKIPDFVLQELSREWREAELINRYKNGKLFHGDGKALRTWLQRWAFTWSPSAIDELRRIIEPEMPCMIAYQIKGQ